MLKGVEVPIPTFCPTCTVSNHAVEEAVRDIEEPWNQIGVVVALKTVAPKLVVEVQGNVTVPQIIAPLELVVRAREAEQVPKLPIVVVPMLLTANNVEFTPATVDDPTAKTTLLDEEAVCDA